MNVLPASPHIVSRSFSSPNQANIFTALWLLVSHWSKLRTVLHLLPLLRASVIDALSIEGYPFTQSYQHILTPVQPIPLQVIIRRTFTVGSNGKTRQRKIPNE